MPTLKVGPDNTIQYVTSGGDVVSEVEYDANTGSIRFVDDTGSPAPAEFGETVHESVNTVEQTIDNAYQTTVDANSRETVEHTPTGQTVKKYDPNRQSGISFISFPMVGDALAWGDGNENIVADVEFEQQFLEGSGSQSHTITLNNNYDRTVLHVRRVENTSGGNQDIGLQVDGVTADYFYETKTDAANDAQSQGPFIPFGSTFSDGNQSAGVVEMWASSSVPFQANLRGFQVAPGARVNWGYHQSIPDNVDSITITGGSGNIAVEAVVSGWSYKASV